MSYLRAACRLFFFLTILLSHSAIADTKKVQTPIEKSTEAKKAEQETATTEPELSFPVTKQLSRAEQITQIADGIHEQIREIRTLDKTLRKTTLESDVERIEADREEKLIRLKEQQKTLEQIATGAVDMKLFSEQQTAEFVWQDELKEIFKPVISELKNLTEQPRQIEHLRSRKASLELQMEATRSALDEINTLLKKIDSPIGKKALKRINEDWQERQSDITNDLQLVTFQLSEKLNHREKKSEAVARAFKNFFTGRGLNIGLAILAFIVTFFTMKLFAYLIKLCLAPKNTKDKESRFTTRLAYITFKVLTVLASIVALLAMLYILEDWLVLTLVLIALIALLFALRNSLPRYIDEARLLLDIGPVREGERVTIDGIAWHVSRLNFYSILINPALTGGKLRLPLDRMLELTSRRWSKQEPWFPCTKKDYVLLSDDTFGQVVLQSPDVVQIQVPGGEVKYYITTEFLTLTPRSLSEGYGLYVTFGLDYGLQKELFPSVLDKLSQGVRSQLAIHGLDTHLEDFQVEFQTANTSSLDFVIITKFNGYAAKDYAGLKRFLQRAAVETCNQNGWSIPFNQLTIHTAND